MSYKKMVPNESQTTDYYPQKKSRYQYHGTIAGILIVIALIIRFGIPLLLAVKDPSDVSGIFAVSLLGAIFWIWGCFHLALHFDLHFSWGFAGLLFLVGIVIILWAARQKPKWDRQRAVNIARSKAYRGDSDSLY